MIKFVLNLFNEVNLKPKNFKAVAIGFACFFVFVAMLVAETAGVFSRFDVSMTEFLQAGAPRAIDMPLSVFSLLGSFEIMGTIVVLLGLIIYRKRKIVYYPLALFGIILVFEFIGKLFLYHPSPPSIFLRYDLPFSFFSSAVQTKYSFPSGHVSRTLFVAITAVFFGLKFLPKYWGKISLAFWILFSIVMIVSRVYLGEHWASDTIGGLFLGSAMGFFALIYYKDEH